MLMDRLWLGPRLVGRLGSGVRVSASIQMCLVASCYVARVFRIWGDLEMDHGRFRILKTSKATACICYLRKP